MWSERNQRAIAEAIADWRHDARRPRSLAGIVRAVLFVFFDEIGITLRSGWMLRLCAWVATFCAAEWLVNGPMPAVPGDVRLSTNLTQFLPLAAFAAIATAPRRLGSPIIAFGLMVVAMGAAFGTQLMPLMALVARLSDDGFMYLDSRQSAKFIGLGIALTMLAELIRTRLAARATPGLRRCRHFAPQR